MLTKIDSQLETLIDCLNSDEETISLMYKKAKSITSQNFGFQRSLFNPIYVSDICLADCPYCGYRVSNKDIPRKTLKPNEIIKEVDFLVNRGVKNILLLAGDYKHSKYVEMLRESLKVIKANDEVNWIGIEVASLEVEEYRILNEFGATSVTIFQETYNKQRYLELHQNVEYKGDFDYRYNGQERAINAGFKEVGFGILYGVGFWKEDTVLMAEHALSIQAKYPNVKLRFSFPRLQLSEGQDKNCKIENISEYDLLKAIIGIRLLFPKASLVLTGRESVNYLTRHAQIVNILGYNGATAVGGYTDIGQGLKQFNLNSNSSFETFKKKIKDNGFNI